MPVPDPVPPSHTYGAMILRTAPAAISKSAWIEVTAAVMSVRSRTLRESTPAPATWERQSTRGRRPLRVLPSEPTQRPRAGKLTLEDESPWKRLCLPVARARRPAISRSSARHLLARELHFGHLSGTISFGSVNVLHLVGRETRRNLAQHQALRSDIDHGHVGDNPVHALQRGQRVGTLPVRSWAGLPW